MKRLVLDTSVLLHLIKPHPTVGQEAAHAAAWRLLREEHGFSLCVPAPAMAEVLIGVAPEVVASVRIALEDGFEVLDFDADAAEHTAALLRGRRFDSGPGMRVKAKFDAQIVGTAAARGCALCTTDDGQTRLAKGVDGLDVGPPVHFVDGDQPSLFGPR